MNDEIDVQRCQHPGKHGVGVCKNRALTLYDFQGKRKAVWLCPNHLVQVSTSRYKGGKLK